MIPLVCMYVCMYVCVYVYWSREEKASIAKRHNAGIFGLERPPKSFPRQWLPFFSRDDTRPFTLEDLQGKVKKISGQLTNIEFYIYIVIIGPLFSFFAFTCFPYGRLTGP